jgi:hypothetical protein
MFAGYVLVRRHRMDLVSAEILEIAQGLSPLFLGGMLLLGLLLWLQGARAHRFWLVLLTTLLTGIYGLRHGQEYGMQPLVAGLLLAIAAGALALSLVRMLFFIGAGFLAMGVARAVAPSWNEPLACFLAGGLLGAFLFELWVTALASLLGTLLLAYSSLCLEASLGKVDVVTWASRNGPLLNWVVAVVTVIGILVQYLLQHRRNRLKSVEREKKAADVKEAKEAKEARIKAETPPQPPPGPWWAAWLGRKAG